MDIRTMPVVTLYPEVGLRAELDVPIRSVPIRPVPVDPESLPPEHVVPVRIYRGHRKGEERIVEASLDGKWDRPRPLDPRHDLAQFNPNGFGWGGNGKGSAQLALALLADATGSRRIALGWHHDFKVQVVSSLRFEAWEITSQAIYDWLVRVAIDELRGGEKC